MKIALCFHGLPRLIEKCYPDIKKYFIDNNEVDVYAHFWWDETHKGKINRLHVKEKNHSEENPINIFKNLYNPKKIIYEDCPGDIDISDYPIEGFNNPNIKEDDIFNKIMVSFILYNLFCRFKSINNVINLIEDKENYDVICVIRPDMLLLKRGNFLDEIKNLNFDKNIYFPSTGGGGPRYAGEFPNRIGDWVFLGNYKNIKKYSDIILEDLINKKHDKKYKKADIPNFRNKLFNFNEMKNIINNSDLTDVYTPIHNSERFIYWSKLANVNLEIFNSSISVRRFLVEEWENKNYRKENFIDPSFYVDLFDVENNKFIENDLLPFYTKNIQFITS